ncbi:MAG: hypothetical protein AMXMBFR57_38240 [Acidimicrobiia bacterium]
MPLHPAVVHLPLGLAFVMPLIAIGFGLALWRGVVRPSAWLAVVGLQVVLLAGGIVALRTGQAEEERVEAAVSEAAIETHEEAAEAFLWLAGLTLVVLIPPVFSSRVMVTRAGVVAGTVMTLVVLGAALRAGHAGGTLVYVHGAGSVGVSSVPPGPQGGTASDDDDRERR